MNKKIEISTMNISIKVLMLDNKRFTKTVYKQLPTYILDDYQDIDLKKYFGKSSLIGYVSDDFKKGTYSGYSLLVNDDGKLKRYEIGFDRDHFDNFFSEQIEPLGQIFISC